tara:strand:+ start:215 stop:1531 length:1317 start_codon:yes stop_codon:yes gene_type:complete
LSARIILSNSGWLIVGKMLSMVAGFFSIALVARVYGPERFGFLSLALSVVALASPLLQLGLNSIVTRDLVNSRGSRDVIIFTVLVMRLISSAFFLLLWLCISGYLSLSQSLETYILILFVAETFKGGVVFSFWLESKNLNKLVAYGQMLSSVSVSALRMFAAFLYVDFYWIVASYILEAAIMTFWLYSVFSRRTGGVKFNFSWPLCSSYLRTCLPLIASGVTAIVYQKIDQLMIGKMVGVEAVGGYAVASRISEVWYFMPVMIVTASFPSLLKKKNEGEQVYERFLETLFSLLALLGFAAAFFVILVAGWFVPAIFGDDYLASVPILIVHIWGGVFISMRALVSKWILAEDRLSYSLVSQGAGALSNVALNLIMIPVMGPLGAAIATLISYSIASFWVFGVLPRSRKIFFMMFRSLLLYRVVGLSLSLLARVRDARNR